MIKKEGGLLSSTDKKSWGSFEVWAKSDGVCGVFYSVNARESVSVTTPKDSASVYRVSSGILLVSQEELKDSSDGIVVTAGDTISLDENSTYIFSAIRDCEVYGVMADPPGEKVGKK